MEKKTARLLCDIKNSLERLARTPSLHVHLWATDMENDNPGVKYFIRDSDKEERDMGLIRVCWHNPVFYGRASRKAQTIASEAYAYLLSEGISCSIENKKPQFMM